MNIETIIKELENNEKVLELSLLYLKITGLSKDYLLNLYEIGRKLGEESISQAIYLAIKNDKETLKIIKEMVEMNAIGNMEVPSYKDTMDTMKEHTAPIDPNLFKKVFKKWVGI